MHNRKQVHTARGALGRSNKDSGNRRGRRFEYVFAHFPSPFEPYEDGHNINKQGRAYEQLDIL